jgi:hypothetical protein
MLMLRGRNDVDQILGIHELKIGNGQPIEIEMSDLIESGIGE